MAKITFIDPIKSVSGKLCKQHHVIHCIRVAPTNNQSMIDNPQYTSWRDPNKRVAQTAAQKAWQSMFGSISSATRARMLNPEMIDTDLAGYAAQTKYKSLYSYVWNQVRKDME